MDPEVLAAADRVRFPGLELVGELAAAQKFVCPGCAQILEFGAAVLFIVEIDTRCVFAVGHSECVDGLQIAGDRKAAEAWLRAQLSGDPEATRVAVDVSARTLARAILFWIDREKEIG